MQKTSTNLSIAYKISSREIHNLQATRLVVENFEVFVFSVMSRGDWLWRFLNWKLEKKRGTKLPYRGDAELRTTCDTKQNNGEKKHLKNQILNQVPSSNLFCYHMSYHSPGLLLSFFFLVHRRLRVKNCVFLKVSSFHTIYLNHQQKISQQPTKNRKFDFSEGHNFLCKKFGRHRLCKVASYNFSSVEPKIHWT